MHPITFHFSLTMPLLCDDRFQHVGDVGIHHFDLSSITLQFSCPEVRIFCLRIFFLICRFENNDGPQHTYCVGVYDFTSKVYIYTLRVQSCFIYLQVKLLMHIQDIPTKDKSVSTLYIYIYNVQFSQRGLTKCATWLKCKITTLLYNKTKLQQSKLTGMTAQTDCFEHVFVLFKFPQKRQF